MGFDIPDACTLPTAERPMRLAEFDDLFATAVRGVETPTPTRARLRLVGPPGLEATVRDLAAREAACCSFFTFTVAKSLPGDADALLLDIEVPPEHGEVLASLAARATTAAGRR